MTEVEFAERAGMPLTIVKEIIDGEGAITFEGAKRFERVLGVSAAFWIAREKMYRESLERKR